MKRLVILLLVFFFQSNLVLSQKLDIVYLANMGIHIKTDKTEILIDGVFDKKFDYLDVLPKSELNKIKNARANYKSIDIILVTHLHGDHYNADIIGSHLIQNKEAFFLAPKETIDNFKKNFARFNIISNRIKQETPDLFKSKSLVIKGVKIKVLRTEHLGNSPWKEAENIAYLIQIGKKKIIHFGDSQIDVKNLEKFKLKDESIDIAILPFSKLGPPKQIKLIEKYINPKLILAAHIPPNHYSNAQEIIEGLGYKNAIALVKQLKTIIIK